MSIVTISILLYEHNVVFRKTTFECFETRVCLNSMIHINHEAIETVYI